MVERIDNPHLILRSACRDVESLLGGALLDDRQRQAYAGLERTEDVLRESALDWVAVRPTTLTQGPREDRVVVTARYRAWDRIAREDVAAFLLRQLEAPTLAHRTPMITGGG